MPSTWIMFSTEIYGEVLDQTPARERYVAYKKVEKWLAQGYGVKEIAAIWNSGQPHGWEQKRGINKHGVEYDVPKYVRTVLAYM